MGFVNIWLMTGGIEIWQYICGDMVCFVIYLLFVVGVHKLVSTIFVKGWFALMTFDVLSQRLFRGWSFGLE